ncbi:hypothetical protein ACQVP2_07295 [Methylobacterium aquaticum]|uniref:hypothetical protein n=1 Tax=Methylobacterium aquaticum TaxID=270351 RepID=UPI003D178C5A
MAEIMFDPDLMVVYERIERKTEREVFGALILAMMVYMPNFPTSEFFGLCASGVDDGTWMPRDMPDETREFARSVMENVMRQMLGQDPRGYLKKFPPNYERDV